MDEVKVDELLEYNDAKLILDMVKMAIGEGCYVSVSYHQDERYLCLSFDKTPIDEKEEA